VAPVRADNAFAGVSAAYSVLGPTQIQATVPATADSGPIVVTTAGGSGSSTGSFTVTTPAPVPAPTLTGFSPSSGRVGTSVTLTGTNLTGATAVTFSGVAAQFTVRGAAQIKAKVPNGARTGQVPVTTPGGTATGRYIFTVR
jgi:hypothetical protein